MTQGSMASDPGYRWVVLGIVLLTMLSFAVSFQAIPPVLSLIIQDLRLTHSEAGLLMSLFALPGVFLSIPVGVLSDRYGPRNLIILCLAALIVGSLLVAVGRSFSVLALGRIIAGAGGVSLTVVGAQYVSHWFAGRERGMAIGIYSTSMPIGTILSLNTLGGVGKAHGWQTAVAIGVAVSIVAIISFVILYRPAPAAQEHQAHQAQAEGFRFETIFKLGLPIWLLAVTWAVFNAAVIAFLTFGPDYFLDRGYGIEFAGFLASFLMLLSPFLAPGIGFLLDRASVEELLMGISGLLIAFSLFAITLPGAPLISLLILLSVGAALTPTSVFALAPKILQPQYVGTGYGIVSTCLNLGTMLGPFTAGLARDATGSYQLSLYLMSGYGAAATVLAVVLFLARRGFRPSPQPSP